MRVTHTDTRLNWMLGARLILSSYGVVVTIDIGYHNWHIILKETW